MRAMLLLASSLLAQEARYYATDYLAPPPDAAAEVGGMGFLPDGRLVVSTRTGQVWIVRDALAADPRAARWSLFADGLQEGFGLAVTGAEIHVLQRGELSQLTDVDGDGRCDRVTTIAKDWGLSGNYHEFAFGLPRDARGHFFVALNLGFFEPAWWHGKAKVPRRGCVLEIAPDGTTTEVARGFRSPDGIALAPTGELFVTDNQGDWMPVCGVFHVRPGRFYGHPASLPGASDTEPPDSPRTQPAIWLPYSLSRSTGNLAWDPGDGKFGPFRGQCFAAELTNGRVIRLLFDKVRGEWQGAAIGFRDDTGSAHRLCFATDGTLLVGLTNRGWGGAGKAHGITRVRWTGETPREIATIRATAGGFALTFTTPLAAAPRAGAVTVTQYDYRWWWKYGSPETNTRTLECTSEWRDGVLHLQCADLRPGFVTRIVLRELGLLHEQIDYTLHQLPDGPTSDKVVAVRVEPPLTREQEALGWYRLHDPRDLQAFGTCVGFAPGDSPGVVAGELTQIKPGAARDREPGCLVSERGGELVTRAAVGAAQIRLEFMLPKGGSADLVLPGGQIVQLRDDPGCGTLVTGEQTFAPRVAAYERAGEWQTLDVWLDRGRIELNHKQEVNQARLELDPAGYLIHDGVPLGGTGPLRLRARTAFALRAFRVKSLAPRAETARRALFAGAALPEWTVRGEAAWQVVDGVLRGTGKSGTLERSDLGPGEIELVCRVGRGGDAALLVGGVAIPLRDEFLRAAVDGVWCTVTVRVADGRVRAAVNGFLALDVPATAPGPAPLGLRLGAAATTLEIRSFTHRD